MPEKTKLDQLLERCESHERAEQAPPLDIAQLVSAIALSDPGIKKYVSSDRVNEAATEFVNSLRTRVSHAVTEEMISRSGDNTQKK